MPGAGKAGRHRKCMGAQIRLPGAVGEAGGCANQLRAVTVGYKCRWGRKKVAGLWLVPQGVSNATFGRGVQGSAYGGMERI